jgi:hypothetical protein
VNAIPEVPEEYSRFIFGLDPSAALNKSGSGGF